MRKYGLTVLVLLCVGCGQAPQAQTSTSLQTQEVKCVTIPACSALCGNPLAAQGMGGELTAENCDNTMIDPNDKNSWP
jgi:hypothetical protein